MSTYRFLPLVVCVVGYGVASLMVEKDPKLLSGFAMLTCGTKLFVDVLLVPLKSNSVEHVGGAGAYSKTPAATPLKYIFKMSNNELEIVQYISSNCRSAY